MIYKITLAKPTTLLTYSPKSKTHTGGGVSIFDSITCEDLTIAFFPCIYFSCLSQMDMSWTCYNNRNLSIKDATDKILERSANREKYYGLAAKLLAVAKIRGLRLIMENPWSQQHFLKSGFVLPPTIIDNNRMMRGDFFVKPTAYWFINCAPTNGVTFQFDKERKIIIHEKPGAKAGICSEERSMISPDYARNFICDFVLGKEQIGTELRIFNDAE